MSDSSSDEIDIQLELKDRINYPHVLQTTLLNIKKAISNEVIDIDRLEDMMWDFFTDIPHSWYDEDFNKDVRNAFITRRIDNRPVWGGVKLSDEVCEKYNIPTSKMVTGINIFLLKNAIVNLLHRRDMLVRKKKIEYSTGVNLVEKTLDDLEDDEYEDEDDMITTNEDEKIMKELKQIDQTPEDEE